MNEGSARFREIFAQFLARRGRPPEMYFHPEEALFLCFLGKRCVAIDAVISSLPLWCIHVRILLIKFPKMMSFLIDRMRDARELSNRTQSFYRQTQPGCAPSRLMVTEVKRVSK